MLRPMPRTLPDLAAAIRAGDRAAVTAAVAADPSVAEGQDTAQISLICVAAYHDHPEIAALLAAARDDLDIHEAAALGDVAALSRVLEAHPEAARALSPDGFTALHLAAFLGHPTAVGLLLTAGADVEAVADNPMRVRPLHSAAAARRADVVRLLLAAGADPNARQEAGWRPLHSAAHNGDLATLRALLDAGADPGLLHDGGSAPVDLARAAGHREAAELLEA